MRLTPPAVGASLERRDGRAKATGEALYSYEHRLEGVAYAVVVQARAARGAITSVDAAAALALPGVLAVLSHENAPRLAAVENGELLVLQEPRVAYYGQIVAAVVAERLETAQEAADLVAVNIEVEEHDATLRVDHPELYTPKHAVFRKVESTHGDVDAALAEAEVVVDRTYTTPAQHNLALEPHASLASWEGDSLTVYESTQSSQATRDAVATLFGIDPGDVRILNGMVGGGFGSKGMPRPHLVVAVMASRMTGRPVKLTLGRRQTFAISGHRSPTIQRVRLAADREGRLAAWEHVAYAQTSRLNEFCEPSTTGTRVMYAASNRFDTHRLARLDVPTPGFCRAPGEAPGFFAVESALDELAEACGVDPVELRIRNEPDVDPDTGRPFSSRGLVACLREGVERFGWEARAAVREGDLLVGHGVASSMYPTVQRPSSARVDAHADGSYTVSLAAVDLGTGSRTALAQIAADELDVDPEDVDVELGDSGLPFAIGAFASQGTASWGHAIVLACRQLRMQIDERGGEIPSEGLRAFAKTGDELQAQEAFARHAFGAQFAEVAVERATGVVRVTRLLGVFGVGRVVNPRTARSQLLGGMTWGISMALHERSPMDVRYGDFMAKDLSSYHVATAADVPRIDVAWIDEVDPHINPVGSKGVGEIGIVGTAAAIANAVHDATGVRVRDLPITVDKLLR
ncbi:MAG TPA: xanthine dehydrogenase family protein molybdopterin-binding subunit [Gaiellaceae bacterium]|nr:xanthine dehydrogenase family protein molybdopterin-binding subunit [Gaiellaceae bacterium]